MVCPKCNSNENAIRNGIRRNKRTDVQQYFCKACSCKFISADESSFISYRYGKTLINLALGLSDDGYSTREIEKELKEHHGIIVSHATIHHWLHKFQPEGTFTKPKSVHLSETTAEKLSKYKRRNESFDESIGRLFKERELFSQTLTALKDTLFMDTKLRDRLQRFIDRQRRNLQ